MFEFGRSSSDKLATCHPMLQRIAQRALERSPYDFTIIWGWRNQEQQDALAVSGASHAPWPKSKHNHIDENEDPQSLALDFGPWVSGAIPWKETHIFAVIAGCFFAAAQEYGITLRWGGDWDTDGDTTDQTLLDYGHVEIIL